VALGSPFRLRPAATWTGIAIFLRVNHGWYGHGWGDFAVTVTVFIACLTVLASALGPAMRAALHRYREP
jgi:hypothetical protein